SLFNIPMKPPFKRITICGVGLIGASLGLATKRAFPSTHIIGVDRSRRALRTARSLGAIDTIADDWADAFRFSSLIILATPVKGILEWLPRLGAYVSPGTVVSDAGSTKTEILAAAARALPASVHFIGGHPMAGKSVSGAAQADPALFRGATYTLCPGAHRADGALRRLRRWGRALSGRWAAGWGRPAPARSCWPRRRMPAWPPTSATCRSSSPRRWPISSRKPRRTTSRPWPFECPPAPSAI